MRSMVLSSLSVFLSGLAAAQGGSVSGFSRPLGQGLRGGGGGRLEICRQEMDRGMYGACGEPDVTGAFVVPSALWGDAIEASGCPHDVRAALTKKLEAAAGAFNGGLIEARKCVGMQMMAQQDLNCPQARAEWERFADTQRKLFVSRWQNEVRAVLAKCPPPPKEAAKRNRRAAAQPPMCRHMHADDRVSGGCETIPRLQSTGSILKSDMMHSNLEACPQRVKVNTSTIANSRMLNFKFGQNFCWIAANHFLEAQAGVLCEETLSAYRRHDEDMVRTFSDAWLGATAAAGAACRSAPGNSGFAGP